MCSVVRGDGKAFAQGDGSNENVYFADQLAALFEVGPDVGSKAGGFVRERQNAMYETELLKFGKLHRRAFGLQPARDLVVAEFSEGQMTDLRNCLKDLLRHLRMLFMKQAERV